MENLLDLDHMSVDRSPILVSHAASDLNTERDMTTSIKGSGPIIPFPSQNTCIVNFAVDNGTISRSSSLGNEIPLLNVDNTDSAADILMPSRTKETVDFAQLFKEGYYNKPEFHDRHKSTEIVTDEMNTGGNTHEEEKLADEEPEEEGWIGGMFDFSEEGRNLKRSCEHPFLFMPISSINSLSFMPSCAGIQCALFSLIAG